MSVRHLIHAAGKGGLSLFWMGLEKGIDLSADHVACVVNFHGMVFFTVQVNRGDIKIEFVVFGRTRLLAGFLGLVVIRFTAVRLAFLASRDSFNLRLIRRAREDDGSNLHTTTSSGSSLTRDSNARSFEGSTSLRG